jgi:hypothetical protein
LVAAGAQGLSGEAAKALDLTIPPKLFLQNSGDWTMRRTIPQLALDILCNSKD